MFALCNFRENELQFVKNCVAESIFPIFREPTINQILRLDQHQNV